MTAVQRESVKRRLINAWQAELEEAEAHGFPNDRLTLAHKIYTLGQMGSGALPRWARQEALERGLVVR